MPELFGFLFFRKYLPPIFLAAACAAALYAQPAASDSLRQSLAGAFVYELKAGPNGGPSYPILNDAPGYAIDYSFRPLRWLALEAGFEQIVRPIGSAVCCEYSTNAHDQLFLVPFGLRYSLAPAASRLRLTLGGGGAWLNHTIGDEAGGAVGFSGWGGQIVASADYAVRRSGRLRLGMLVRYYFASPKASLNLASGAPSSDSLHIFVLGPEVVFSFR